MPQNQHKLSKIFKKSYLVYSTLIAFVFIQVYFLVPSIKNNRWQTTANDEKKQTVDQNQFVSDQIKSKSNSQEQKMNGVHLVENDGDSKGWELFSEEASGTREELWVLKKVKIKFYKDENSNFSVAGDVGEINGQTKDMIIRGHVITESVNGYKFETDELKYDSKNKKLYTTDLVKMLGPNDKNGTGLNLTGQGLDIFTQTNLIKINSLVEADKIIDSKKFKLKAETAEFSNNDREAVFSGQVKINYGDIILKSPYARFEYLKSKDVLSMMTAYDNVQFSENNKSGVCSELIVDLIADKMTLNGQPIVKIGDDEIKGDQIVFTNKGQNVKINKMNLVRKDFKN